MLFLIPVLHAQSVDLTSASAVKAATQSIAANLMNYYVPGKSAEQGCIYQNTAKDSTGFQWYEGGIMWGAIMEYMKTFNDPAYATITAQALTLASYGKAASFLGTIPSLAETVQGKWNDDILWWGLGSLTGMELFGKDAQMPGGLTYFRLTNTTFQQVWAQWDATLSCGGGIFWSRDRSSVSSKGYKSVITHAQEMLMGARLTILTGDPSYAASAEQAYKWLKTSNLITSDFKVLDGLDSQNNCKINQNQLSYKAGFTVGALAWLSKATGKKEYMSDANQLARQALATFSSSTNGIITDQCEVSAAKCPENQVSPKGTMIRGLGYLYEQSDDVQTQQAIKTALIASASAMLKTCDSNFNCGNYWYAGNGGQSVHYQINALELMTALGKTFSDGPVSAKIAAPTTAPPAPSTGPAPGSAYKNFSYLTLTLVVVTLSLI